MQRHPCAGRSARSDGPGESDLCLKTKALGARLKPPPLSLRPTPWAGALALASGLRSPRAVTKAVLRTLTRSAP